MVAAFQKFSLLIVRNKSHCEFIHRYRLYMHSSKFPDAKEWIPQNNLSGKGSFAILLLNQPLCDENKRFLKQNWNSAVLRVAVDGGANHLKGIFDSDMLNPDIICGDFDSVTPENLKFFQEQGTIILPTPDQDDTDFTKALKLTLEYLNKNNLQVSSIIAIVRCGERLDHLFGNLNTLFYAVQWSSIPVFLLGNGSLTWLLPKGSHKIQVPSTMRNSNIGLIPLGSECTNVTTTGLKWNLTNDKMKFGSLISTSNRFDADASEVTILTDTELIWTMEVKMIT